MGRKVGRVTNHKTKKLLLIILKEATPKLLLTGRRYLILASATHYYHKTISRLRANTVLKYTRMKH